jgi:hypothetical protein
LFTVGVRVYDWFNIFILLLLFTQLYSTIESPHYPPLPKKQTLYIYFKQKFRISLFRTAQHILWSNIVRFFIQFTILQFSTKEQTAALLVYWIFNKTGWLRIMWRCLTSRSWVFYWIGPNREKILFKNLVVRSSELSVQILRI